MVSSFWITVCSLFVCALIFRHEYVKSINGARQQQRQRQLLLVQRQQNDILFLNPKDSHKDSKRLQSPVRQSPNIILFLADDLGYMDVGFNNGLVYETPSLDQLAASGVIFSNAYQNSNCAPSRASLMTGMFPPAHHIYTSSGASEGRVEFMRLLTPLGERARIFNKPHTQTSLPFKSTSTLSPKHVSVAELVNRKGYRTARIGKWHLGEDLQGFQYSTLNGLEEAKSNGTKQADSQKAHNFYGDPNVADSLTDSAVDFIMLHRHEPFFLFLSHWDVHRPVRALEEREQRAQYRLSNITGGSNESLFPWQCSAAYGGMIYALDESANRILKILDGLSISNRTLFIFMSDNGGALRSTSNAPLRHGKGSLFEGGIRVPAFFSWPGVIPKGQILTNPVHGVDILPTICELAGLHKSEYEHVDGISLVPLVMTTSDPTLKRSALFWHMPLYLDGADCTLAYTIDGTEKLFWRNVPSSAVRANNFKLIYYFESNSSVLFDLNSDVGETFDLSFEMPDKKRKMENLLFSWLHESLAPVPQINNPEFQPCHGEDPDKHCRFRLQHCQ
eukprot:m.30848 g.30848  ORF g.30848 m.30848 type:complete len:561 (+) comp8251_c0_seq1:214-1896(+)